FKKSLVIFSTLKLQGIRRLKGHDSNLLHRKPE
ncbi:MAG: hypothetical protein ACI92G_003517, partial [Candidatus Pelagisphaera sp.]